MRRSIIFLWIAGLVSLLSFILYLIAVTLEGHTYLLPTSIAADLFAQIVAAFVCFFVAYTTAKERKKGGGQSILPSIIFGVFGTLLLCLLLVESLFIIGDLVLTENVSPPPSPFLHLSLQLGISLIFFFFAYSQGGDKNPDQEPEPNP